MLQTYQTIYQRYVAVRSPHWTPYEPAGLDCIAVNENGYGKTDDASEAPVMLKAA